MAIASGTVTNSSRYFSSLACSVSLAQLLVVLCGLALHFGLWRENRLLGTDFITPREYALSTTDKCPETSLLRNLFVNARTFGGARAFQIRSVRYPRQRLLHSLCLLLWEDQALNDASMLRALQQDLNSRATDFAGLVDAYEQLWHRFN